MVHIGSGQQRREFHQLYEYVMKVLILISKNIHTYYMHAVYSNLATQKLKKNQSDQATKHQIHPNRSPKQVAKLRIEPKSTTKLAKSCRGMKYMSCEVWTQIELLEATSKLNRSSFGKKRRNVKPVSNPIREIESWWNHQLNNQTRNCKIEPYSTSALLFCNGVCIGCIGLFGLIRYWHAVSIGFTSQ